MASVVDTTPPVFTFTPVVQPLAIGETIRTATTIDLASIPSHQVSNATFITYIVDHVSDNIDGIIPNSSINVTLYDQNFEPVNAPIFSEGHYIISLTATDSHMNSTTVMVKLYLNDTVYNSAPEIFYTNNVTNNSAVMMLSTNYGSGIGVITKTDLLTYSVASIFDDNDGNIIPTTSIITITNNINNVIANITSAGVYNIKYTLMDSNSNTRIKTINILVN